MVFFTFLLYAIFIINRKIQYNEKRKKERVHKMTPKEVEALGYPSNIQELIETSEGVSLIDETEHYYVIYDEYDDVDRELQINKEPEVKEDYFEFFSNDMDKEAVLAFARTLPPLLFMNLKKVFFLEKDEDLVLMDEESPNHTFSFDDARQPLGMAVYCDSVACINLRLMKALAKEEQVEDEKTFGYAQSEKEIILEIIKSTLAHELFHLMQFNPLIEEYIPEGEEPTERFCRHYMK